MKTLSKQKLLTIFAATIMSVAPLAAQVTIGSGIDPSKGALLDLKDHSTPGDQTTATKGLLLPRVNLTNLKPTPGIGSNGLSASIGSPASEDWNWDDHIGLNVYNVNDTWPFCPGAYVWNGQEWQRLGTPCKYTYQCGSGTYPTMSLWALLAGFLNVPESQGSTSDAQEIATLKRDTPDPTTGIAWHRDQDGNIFLSASFDASPTSNAQRWMITNLAARSYATGSRTGTDATVITPLPASPSAASDNVNPLWAYPHPIPSNGTISTIYDNNPRIGLLYNWPAATNSRAVTIDEGEGSSTPQTAKIQGICPNGWHLPSDREWTYLEQEISDNTSRYSSLPDAGTTITVGQINRGTTHGAAMKEECELYDSTHQGKSNTITTAKRPGFEALLAGFASNGSTGFYGSAGFWWSASSAVSLGAWSRSVGSGYSHVGRSARAWFALSSVRCKKD